MIFGRLQHHVAVLVVAQLAGELTDSGTPLLLVKGGSSLELRRGIASSRTSRDLDAVVLGNLLVAHDRLADAGATGWAGFTAVVTPPEPIDVPGMPVKPFRFSVKLSFRGRPFATVPMEVSAVESGNAAQFDLIESRALDLVGLPASTVVPCMTVPWQIAQKLHACTAEHGPSRVNDRAHDLIDLQLLGALMEDTGLADARNACVAVFEARDQHTWPPHVVAWPHWPGVYAQGLEGLAHLDLAATVEEAAHRTQELVDRIEAAG